MTIGKTFRESIQADIAGASGNHEGNLTDSKARARAALERARASDDPRLVVQALQANASVCELGGELTPFYAFALEAEGIAAEHGFEPELARANFQIGQCLVAAGHFDRALTRLGDALRLYRSLDDATGEHAALQALAGFHLAQGQYRNMFVYLDKSLQMIRPDEPTEQRELFHAGIAEGHAHYATALLAQGHLFEAQVQCERALALLPRRARLQVSSPRSAGAHGPHARPAAATDTNSINRIGAAEARLLDTTSRLHLLQGHGELAARCAAALLRLGRVRGAAPLVAAACDRFADLRLAQGRPAKAVRWLAQSRQLWGQLGMHREQVVALDRLSDAQAALGRFAEALSFYKQARRIEDEARSAQAELRAELMAVEVDAERRRLAEQEALEHTNRLAAVGRMVACIAHEVTQPLSAIRLVAETSALDPAQSRAEAQASLARIVRLVDQLTVYVRHLKRFTRRDDVKVEPVRLSTVVDEAMAIVEPKRRLCNVTLALDVEDADVLADSTRASGILVNLLCNAFDAAAASDRRQVKLIARVAGDRAVLEVRDHGEGLSPQTLARLFEPFYTTKRIGSGLGLSLSMDLARRMGAHLGGANHPDGGACFTLDMALAPKLASSTSAGLSPIPISIPSQPVVRPVMARAAPARAAPTRTDVALPRLPSPSRALIAHAAF